MNEAYRVLLADVYELAGLSRRISDREAAALDSTAAQWHVLSVISDGPVTVPSIARRLGTVRQAVQRVVDDLARHGRVTLVANPGNRRSPLVELTETGSALLDRLWHTTAAPRRAALDRGRLTDSELYAARQTLRRLIDALNDAPS